MKDNENGSANRKEIPREEMDKIGTDRPMSKYIDDPTDNRNKDAL